MDFLPRGREFEMVRRKSFLSKDFKRSISFLSQFIAGSHCGDVRPFQPNSVSFFVVLSIRPFLVIKCLHCFHCFGQYSLCFSSCFHEVISEVLGRLALNFAMGFESFIGVSPVVEEER